MADKYAADYNGRDGFKETVCIDAMRIYDSCSDKDCLEDLRVYIPQEQQQLVDCAKDVRIRNVDVISVYTDLQELPFNNGYYTVDLTFYFDICLELSAGPGSQCVPVSGISVFTKKCVMYGSEGGVKTFYSDMNRCSPEIFGSQAQPKVSVQVAEPVALSARLCECCHMHHDPCCCMIDNLPPNCRSRYGTLDHSRKPDKGVYATIGLFTILQMIRNVQMMIPAYDFCVPTKECSCSGANENPCELFNTIDFPTDAFFPPKANDDNIGDDKKNCCC